MMYSETLSFSTVNFVNEYISHVVCDVIPGAVPGVTEYTRAQVVKKLWEYIREHDLQNADNRQQIDCTLR